MSEWEEQQVRRLRAKIEREGRRGPRTGDMHLWPPRAARAHRFANLVQAMLRDFLPTDRDCQRRIADYLLEVGYENNLEIINVPPECDELEKLALERRRLET